MEKLVGGSESQTPPSPLGAFGWVSGTAEGFPFCRTGTPPPRAHSPVLQGPGTWAWEVSARLTGHLASLCSRLSRWAQASSLGPPVHWAAAPPCWSQRAAPMTAAWTSPSAAAMTLVPQDWCLTTEPPRRSCAPAQGLLPLCWGARGTRGRCLGAVQPHCREAGSGCSGSHWTTSPHTHRSVPSVH